jgi:membrane protein DedA with SNARE-associated domain
MGSGVMNEYAAEWLGWVQSCFTRYGCWFVLVSLFLKNLIFLGPFMPGAVVMVVAGWLGRQGQASLPLLALSGIVGTVAGDTVSYFIGRKAGDRLLRSKRWGKAIAAISERVRDEPALILFCQFETFLRMFVPAAAGLSGVPFGRWLLLTTVGAALWVAAYGAAGYFLSLPGGLAAGKTIAFVVIGLLIVTVVAHHFLGRYLRPRESAGEPRDR